MNRPIPPLVLGSQSPRRKEILSFFSVPFTSAAPPYDETHVVFKEDPVTYALALSKGKARSLRPQFPHSLILTADTVVYKEGQLFNKPTDENEAFMMLQALNGSGHSVFTAVTALHGEKESSLCEETKVYFQTATFEELRLYHQTFHGLDKAGGYGIQEGGSLLIKKIEGCFYNVMGLPLSAVSQLLKQFGINLWHFLA